MANFNFINLSQSVREKMISEIESDISNDCLYKSPRLSETGAETYPELLKESVLRGNEASLTEALGDLMNSVEVVNNKTRKVPKNAASLLAQSEFNRFYIRGICCEAIENGIEEVEVYRGRESSWSRPESDAVIGNKISAKELLEDLRNNIGKQPKYLPEINSGLTVKL